MSLSKFETFDANGNLKIAQAFMAGGTPHTVLHGSSATVPAAYGPVDLALEVTGTLADGSLSSNVPLKNGTNAFTGANSFATNPLDLLIGQLKFPAAFNPSANPNTLDDYEEGTWTPHVEFGGATAGITYGLQVGFYVKIGTLLCYSGRIDLTSKGISAGAATIAALPFAEVDGAANGGNFSYYANMAAAVVAPNWNVTGTTMNLTYSGGGGVVGLANTDFTNTTVLIWSGWYRT
jgi:hypothetical protein